MHLIAQTPAVGTSVLLVLALALAFGFECINGFHDTANAVATVIYTNTLRPWIAVVWSGIWNLIGVLTSSGAVAFGIVALLPVELVINVGSASGFAMVFALLLAAMIWNLGTWYLGLPASSSHSLIGSIMGVGLANALMSSGHHFAEGVNWAKAQEVGLALLLSPLIGFVASALLLLVLKLLVKKKELYEAPAKDQPPPWYMRIVLFLTCTGVSFAHGSNDGQKGMGLIMLILVGVVPGTYALKLRSRFQIYSANRRLSERGSAELRKGSQGSDRHSRASAFNSLGVHEERRQNVRRGFCRPRAKEQGDRRETSNRADVRQIVGGGTTRHA